MIVDNGDSFNLVRDVILIKKKKKIWTPIGFEPETSDTFLKKNQISLNHKKI